MLQGFYRDLFDRKIDANDEWQYGMVETGGEGGINGGISGDQDGSSRVSIYAAVDDLQTYLEGRSAGRQGGDASHRNGRFRHRLVHRSSRQRYRVGQRRIGQRKDDHQSVKSETGS
jgi:hypothetical protein